VLTAVNIVRTATRPHVLYGVELKSSLTATISTKRSVVLTAVNIGRTTAAIHALCWTVSNRSLVDSCQQLHEALRNVDSCQRWQAYSGHPLHVLLFGIDQQPNRHAPRSLGLAVVTRRLLNGPVLGLPWPREAQSPDGLPRSDIRPANPRAENSLASSPAIAQRRYTIKLTDCGVSALSSMASQRSMARKTALLLMSARCSHSRRSATGRPTRSTLPASSASPVLVRPSWIVTHGNVGEMGYEFERETFGCRPRQRPTSRCQRPGFQVGQVGGQRSQRVFAYAFLGKVLQRGGILTGQEFGESVAPLHRQDRRQRIELQGSSHFRVRHQRT